MQTSGQHTRMANCWLTAAALRVIVWGVPVTASELPHGRTATRETHSRAGLPRVRAAHLQHCPADARQRRRRRGRDAGRPAPGGAQALTFRGDSQIATWLHRVTVNAALAHRAKRATRQKHETGDAVDEISTLDGPGGPVKRWNVSPEEPILAAEQAELIEQAIKRLPEPFRDVYVLADVEGLPNNEIAEMLEMSVPAVKSRLHRARLRMRDSLAPHFEGVTP